MRAIRRQITIGITSTLVAGVLLSGCGSSGSSDRRTSSVADQGMADQAPAAPEQVPAQDRADGQAEDTPAQAPDLSVDRRSIIYRGSVTVRVKDVNVAAGETTGIATTYGGFISADSRTSDGGAGSGTMQVRVPADKFAATVDRLSKLGDEEHREINTEDVTEQTVDLDARIAVQQARMDSGRRLLAQAKSLNDLVMLEKEVATREADLASLQAKKRRLADLTALSTITVTFLGPAAVVPSDDPDGFMSGLAAGWDALVASLRVLLTVLGALLPWLLVLGLPAWAVFYAVRRFNRSRSATGRPTLVAAGPETEGLETGGPETEGLETGGPETGGPVPLGATE